MTPYYIYKQKILKKGKGKIEREEEKKGKEENREDRGMYGRDGRYTGSGRGRSDSGILWFQCGSHL